MRGFCVVLSDKRKIFLRPQRRMKKVLTHSLRLPLLVRRPLQEQLQESHLRRPPLSHHQTVSYANVVRCPKALLSFGHRR